MIDQRELYALFTLLDDPQGSVQEAVRDRLLELGEEAVAPLRQICASYDGQHADRIEDFVNEIRMAATLGRLGASYRSAVPNIDLEEGVFTIARFGYPETEMEAYHARLDEMASDVRVYAGKHAAPIDLFMRMRTHLFNELSFIGNRNDYYNPDNSYLHKVLEYRRGIPITLSVLMMLVGRRLDISLNGIGMPMHFLVQFDDGTRMFFVDAFNSGMIITQEQCRSMLQSSGIQFAPQMLAPVSDKEILERMWRNLLLAYQQKGNTDEVARVGEILGFINPEFKVNIAPPEESDSDEEEGDGEDDDW